MGNRLTKTPLSGITTSYGYNDFNEILNAGSFPYTHDNNGNIIKAGTFDFVYNDEHQLVEFKSSGALVASYEYDWRGLRSKKVTSSKTELYYYTGNDLTYITDGTNNLKYYFVRDLKGRLQQMIDYTAATPKSYIYILDVHGNVIGLADDTGVLVNYEYDAWGYLLNTPQSGPITGNGEPLASANPFRYSGYQFDVETGFYYLKYRYYIPSLGRFLTRDPMISRNRHVYCRNNPVNFVDPLGLIQKMEYDGATTSPRTIVPPTYVRPIIQNPVINKTDSKKEHNLTGMDFQIGGSVVAAGRFGVQILSNEVDSYLVIYLAGGTEVGPTWGAQGSIGIVTYNSSDISVAEGTSLYGGPTGSAVFGSATYNVIYNPKDNKPIGHYGSAGPSLRAPGVSWQTMVSRALFTIKLAPLRDTYYEGNNYAKYN